MSRSSNVSISSYFASTKKLVQANTDPMTVEMDDWHHLTLVVKYNSADTQNWNKTMNANGIGI